MQWISCTIGLIEAETKISKCWFNWLLKWMEDFLATSNWIISYASWILCHFPSHNMNIHLYSVAMRTFCFVVAMTISCLLAIQYHQEPNDYKTILKYLNSGFTVMFTIECTLKLIGFGRVREQGHRSKGINLFCVLLFIYITNSYQGLWKFILSVAKETNINLDKFCFVIVW